MTIRATTSILLASSLIALTTACVSSADEAVIVPRPVRGCTYAGPISGRMVVSRYADTVATPRTAQEALDTAAAVLRRDGYTVAERAPGAAVITRGGSPERPRPMGVRADAAGAQRIVLCALWNLRSARASPERPSDPAPREAVALFARIREAVLAGT